MVVLCQRGQVSHQEMARMGMSTTNNTGNFPGPTPFDLLTYTCT